MKEKQNSSIKNDNSESKKKQDFKLSFQDFITKIQKVQNKDKMVLLNVLKSFSEKFTFIPITLSYDKKNEKILKRPLIKWKNEISSKEKEEHIEKLIKKYQKGSESLGVALKLDGLDVLIIDIDDLKTFKEALKQDEEKFLKELEKDAFLIIKTLRRGFHIYLNSILGKKLTSLLENDISNSELQRFLGFELKTKGLILFPPSFLKCEAGVFESKVLYVNPENFKKIEMESQTLKRIYELIEELRFEKSKKEIKEAKKELEKERLNYKNLKKIIEEVKKKNKFKDFLKDRCVKDYGEYEVYHCPFHPPDENPSFAVYKNDGNELAIDFHEQRKGDRYFDIVKFYQKLKNCDFLTALKDLCKKAGLVFSEKEELESPEYSETSEFFLTDFVSKKGRKVRRYAISKRWNEIWYIEQDVDTREISLRKKVALFSIEKGTRYFDPITSSFYYDLILKTNQNLELNLNEAPFEKILEKVRNSGLVADQNLIKNALPVVLSSLFKARKIKDGGIPKKGIFWEKGRKSFILSKISIDRYDKENLRNALSFLDEIFYKFYFHIKEKFATVFKWFLIAPFSFSIKQTQIGNFIPALYLYGFSGTGKSSLAIICSYLWSEFKNTEYSEKAGACVNTLPRLGEVLGRDTFPVIISEPADLFARREFNDIMKNAISNPVLRGKFHQGDYKEFLALSNVVFTSNFRPPDSDTGLLRRLYVISFTKNDKPVGDQDEFLKYKDIAKKFLPDIGKALLFHVNEFKNFLFSLSEDKFLKVAENFLNFLYEKAGLQLCEWAGLTHENELALKKEEDERDVWLLVKMKEIFLKEIKEKSQLLPEGKKGREALKGILEEGLVPFAFIKNDRVFLTKEILNKIGDERFPSLKALAEVLNCQYIEKYSLRIQGKVRSISVVLIPWKDLTKIVFSEKEKPQLDLDDVFQINSENNGVKIWTPEELNLKISRDLGDL